MKKELYAKYVMWAGTFLWFVIMVVIVAGTICGGLYCMDKQSLVIITMAMSIAVFLVLVERSIDYHRRGKNE